MRKVTAVAGLIALVTFLVLGFLYYGQMKRYQESANLGDEVVAKVEAFRARNSYLPDSLNDIGIEETLDGPVYYDKRSNDKYQVSFAMSLGESITYDSTTGSWLPALEDYVPSWVLQAVYFLGL